MGRFERLESGMATEGLSFPIYLRLFIREANLIMFSCETLSSESLPISTVLVALMSLSRGTLLYNELFKTFYDVLFS